jgi:5'-3' exonuclease
MRYALIDTANTFFRARYVASRNSDVNEKLGMALHITLSSVNQAVRNHRIDHVVFCLEGRSWRKDFYEPYKKNRAVAKAALTESELEEDKLFWETFEKLKTFLIEKTNCTVLRHNNLEADDLISGWIQHHSEDDHIIVSSDTDFYQLLAANVSQYNGITEELHTINGIFDKKNKQVIDKKTKQPKTIPNPEWLLFEKCIRGDSTDNVFSAYPGVRIKGSKNKVGLIEAFEDRKTRGFSWNNLMLQRWTDHNSNEHRVLDDYERNRTLIDLKAQPAHVKEWITETIITDSVPKNKLMIGIEFLKFCGKYELNRLSEMANSIADILSKPYPSNE